MKRIARFRVLRWAAVAALIAPLMFVADRGVSQSTPPAPTSPAIRVAEGAQVTVAQGQTFFASAPARSLESDIHPLLKSAARRLNNDPDRIYEFVYNAIAVEPEFGLAKGAVGAYVNRSGTPFDQAELMVKMLRAAGYTARYRYGPVNLNASQFQAWMGTSNADAARRILTDGGFPNDVTGTGTLTQASFLSVWVEAQIGGQWYQFDPAFKTSTWYSPADFKTLMGYDRTATRTAAGALTTSGAVLQYTGSTGGQLGTLLTTEATTLQSALNTGTYAQSAPEAVLGGSRIQYITRTQQRLTSLPEAPGGTSATWSGEIPDLFRVKITTTSYPITSGYSPTTAVVFGDAYYADMYRITSSAPSNTFRWLGLNYGSTAPGAPGLPGGMDTISITLDHPYPAGSGVYGDATYVQKIYVQHPEPNPPGVTDVPAIGFINLTGVTLALGHEDPRAVDLMTRQGAGTDACSNGVSDFGMIYPYAYICGQGAKATLSRVSQAVTFMQGLGSASIAAHHTLAFEFSGASKEAWDGSAPDQPGGPGMHYLLQQGFSIVSVQSEISVAALSGSSTDRSAAIGGHAALFALAEEGDMLPAIDRNTAQDFANYYQTGNSANRFIWVTPANLSSATAQLTGYSTTSMARLTEYISAGYSVLAPKSGAIGPGNQSYMKSAAFWAVSPNGHVASVYVEPGGVVLKGAAMAAPDASPKPPGLSKQYADEFNRGRFDPSGSLSVDKQSGLHDFTPPTLLSTGSGDFPRRLDFKVKIQGEPTRAAQSNISLPEEVLNGAALDGNNGGTSTDVVTTSPRLERAAIGYTIYTSLEHDLSLGEDLNLSLGSRSAAEAAPAIVAAVTAMEEFRAGADGLSGLVQLGVQYWLPKQVQDSVATIVHGVDGIEKFVRAVDGTWLAPPDSLESLTQTGVATNLYAYNRRAQRGVSFLWRGKDGATKSFGQHVQALSCFSGGLFPSKDAYGIGRAFGMDVWTLPGGETVTADYDAIDLGTGAPSACGQYQLRRLRNNYGRYLEFAPLGSATVPASDGTLSYVRDENGREVRRTPSGTANGNLTAILGGFSGWRWGAAQPDAYQIGYLLPENQRLWLEAEDCRQGWKSPYEQARTYCDTLKLYYNDPKTPLQTVKMDPDDEGVKSIIDGDGNETKFAIMPGYRYAVTDPASHLSSQQYNDRGQRLEDLSSGGRLKTYAYDSRGRLTDEKLFLASDPTVNFTWTSYVYDSVGRRIEKQIHPWMDPATHLPYQSATPIITQTVWNTTWNKPSIERDGRGKEVHYTYSSTTGLPTQVAGATGELKTYEYDTLGRVQRLRILVSTSPTVERIAEYSYDAKGNLTGIVSDPGVGHQNLTTTMGYDLVGNLTSVINPRGYTTAAQYDNIRRLKQVDGPAGDQVVLLYGGNGQIFREEQKTSTANKPAVTSWDYLPSGRVRVKTDPDSAATTYTYDAVGHVRYVDDPAGRRIQYDYLPDGEVSMVTYGVGSTSPRVTSADYYADGSVRHYRDGLYMETGQDFGTVESVRDPWGREAGARYGAGGQYELKTLDAAGNLIQIRIRDSAPVSGGVDRYINFTYDDANRQTSKIVPTTTTGQNLTTNYVYGLADELLSATFTDDRTGGTTQRVAYSYDPGVGRTTSETWWEKYGVTSGFTTGYEYDASGNRTAIVWSDGFKATYAYDTGNRLTQVGWIRPGVGSGTYATYTPDPQGMLGLATFANGSTMTVSHKDSGDVYRAVYAWPGATSSTFTYGYDASHLQNYENTSVNAYGWLPTANSTMTYSGISGQSVGLYNEYGQVTINSTPTTFIYDTRSNMSSNGSMVFTYDYENRMERVTNLLGAEIVKYDYDPVGRRSVKALTGGAKTAFIHAGGMEIADVDTSTGAIVRRYIPGGGADAWVAFVDEQASGAIKYVHQDKHNSVIALSNSAGAVATADQFSYDPYGQSSSSTAGFPFRYTGQRLDPETGLYYYRERYYDPKNGRFMQNDPIGVDGGLNLFAYTTNDPLNHRDSQGLAETGNCAIVPEGTLNCAGDPNAGQQTEEEAKREGVMVDAVIVTALNRNAPIDWHTLRNQPGEIGFVIQNQQMYFVPLVPVSVTLCNGSTVEANRFPDGRSPDKKGWSPFDGGGDSLAGGDAGGHTHGTDLMSGPGPDDALLAKIKHMPAIVLDSYGTTVVEYVGGSVRARLIEGTWEDPAAVQAWVQNLNAGAPVKPC